MVEKIVKQKSELVGITQQNLAEACGCSASQMGQFLNGKSWVNQDVFEKCLQYIGIDLEIYLRRYKIAKDAAEILSNLKMPIEDVKTMERDEMAEKTKMPIIKGFIKTTEEEFDDIVEKKVVDYESCYVYLRTLIIQIMSIGIGEKITPKKAHTSLDNIAQNSTAGAALTSEILGTLGTIAAGFITAGVMSLISSRNQEYKKNTNPLLSLTKALFKI